MKILHLLSTATIGGIEVLCRDIAQNNSKDNVFAFLFKSGPIEEEIAKTGAHSYQLYTISKFNIVKFTKQLTLICEKEKIEVVVVHHDGISILVYYLLLHHQTKGIKYIRYIHSVFEKEEYFAGNCIINLLKKQLMKAAFFRSDRIIAVSKCAEKSFLDNFAIPKEKVSVVYNGIPEKMIKKNEAVQREEHIGIALIYVGRIIYVKGIDILLQAFARLRKENQNVILRLLGDGDYREECEELANRLEIKPFISFEGFQLEKEKYMKQADIFIYPSRCQEAFGISIVEAMSYGLICIASRVGGIPEVIEDGKNGFLFERESSDELYDTLKQTIQLIEEENTAQLKRNAIATAEYFTIEKTIASLNQIYQEICEAQF